MANVEFMCPHCCTRLIVTVRMARKRSLYRSLRFEEHPEFSIVEDGYLGIQKLRRATLPVDNDIIILVDKIAIYRKREVRPDVFEGTYRKEFYMMSLFKSNGDEIRIPCVPLHPCYKNGGNVARFLNKISRISRGTSSYEIISPAG